MIWCIQLNPPRNVEEIHETSRHHPYYVRLYKDPLRILFLHTIAMKSYWSWKMTWSNLHFQEDVIGSFAKWTSRIFTDILLRPTSQLALRQGTRRKHESGASYNCMFLVSALLLVITWVHHDFITFLILAFESQGAFSISSFSLPGGQQNHHPWYCIFFPQERN